jgi:aminocarboxymuconate-semialdehyde decarboxylase
MLANMVKRYGADHVVLGTDYPYDMGMEHPVDFIGGTKGISASDKVKIMGANAARLLGISANRRNRR